MDNKEIKKEKNKATFSKNQILSSLKYSKKRDILAAVLKDDKMYSFDDVDKEIDNFLNKEVLS